MALTDFEIHRLETCEMAAWEDFFRAAGQEVAERAGIAILDSDHGLIGCVREADVLALNRALGLGVRHDARPEAPMDLIQEYDQRLITRFFVPLSPCAAPKTIKEDLEQSGFRHYNNWVRVFRSTDDIPRASTQLQVRCIDADHARMFARLVCRNFGWPETIEPWIAATVDRPDWIHYIAFDGAIPAATGAMYRRGHCAWLDFATTEAAYRGRGAQSALLATRIEDAGILGCNMVTMETAEEKPGVSAASFRNAIRLGFQVGYLRPNYIWERGPTAG